MYLPLGMDPTTEKSFSSGSSDFCGGGAKSLQSCPTLCDAVNCVARQAPLSMGFSR